MLAHMWDLVLSNPLIQHYSATMFETITKTEETKVSQGKYLASPVKH